MATKHIPNYAFVAVLMSGVVPSVLLFLALAYPGTELNGSPDNSLIHALPGLVILVLLLCPVAWFGYRALGKEQHRNARLSHATSFAWKLAGFGALMVLVAGFYIAPYSEILTVSLSALVAFLCFFAWLFLGSLLQWYLIKSHPDYI